MNKRVSAIIIKNNQILLIHRIKNDIEYFVLPGGTVEVGEGNEIALIREIKEETNLDIVNYKLLSQVREESKLWYIYRIDEYFGKISLGYPEIGRHNKQNQYILEWYNIEDLVNINIIPNKIKLEIIDKLTLK